MQTKTKRALAARAVPAKTSKRAKSGRQGSAATKAARHSTNVLRSAILNIAAEMFAERGFAGTNLRDIADAFGMSRPGLYYHFPSKEKLFEAIIDELTLSAERQLTQIAQDRDLQPDEALRRVIHATTIWLLDHQILFLLLDRAANDLPAQLKESNEASKRRNLQQVVAIIERGIAGGKFRSVDPHIAALAVSGMRNWAAWWFKADGRLPAQQVADIISDMAVRSLMRSDAHRSRSDTLTDAVRILQEDVSHLAYLVKD